MSLWSSKCSGDLTATLCIRRDVTGIGGKVWACIVVSLACLTVGSGIWDVGFTSTVEMLGVPILLAGRYPGWER